MQSCPSSLPRNVLNVRLTSLRFTDGTHGYLVPMTGGTKVARFDLLTLANVKVLNLIHPGGFLGGFLGGFTDGVYGYCVPYNQQGVGYHGQIVRFDLASFSSSSVKVIDLTLTDADLKGFFGGCGRPPHHLAPTHHPQPAHSHHLPRPRHP